jgi:hypothetical protein
MTLDGKVAPLCNMKADWSGSTAQLTLNHTASSASCPGSFTACIHRRGGWVGCIVGLDAMKKRKILCRSKD